MTEKSDFAAKLYQALKSAGYIYTGRINLTDEEYDSYKNSSPKEMADKFAKAHNLAEKTKIFYIFRKLYEDTKSGQKTFKLREYILKEKMQQNEYMYAFMNTPELFVVENASSTHRQYVWARPDAPIFSDADIIFDFVKGINDLKLNTKIKNYIRDNIELSNDELNATLNPGNELKLAFKIKAYHNATKGALNQKKKPAPIITFDRELARSPRDLNVIEKVLTFEEEVKEDCPKDNFTLAEANTRLVTSLDSALMYQKLLNNALEEYYKAKFEAQEKYIDALQGQCLMLAKTGKV